MTIRVRDRLCQRLWDLDAELAALYELRAVDGDPAEIEARIFAEQEEIDRQLGIHIELPLLVC